MCVCVCVCACGTCVCVHVCICTCVRHYITGRKTGLYADVTAIHDVCVITILIAYRTVLPLHTYKLAI